MTKEKLFKLNSRLYYGLGRWAKGPLLPEIPFAGAEVLGTVLRYWHCLGSERRSVAFRGVMFM